MEEFLKTTKDQLQHLVAGHEQVHVVLGNESCDLDSAISALVYAFFLSKSQGGVYLPVLNIPRCQYRLRTEITYLLNNCGITPDLLTFIDDLDLPALAPRLQLTLVDHHALSKQLSPLDECVVSVIDHRPVEKTWHDGVESNIELVGSCCTLIAELVNKGDNSSLDNITAKLLLGTILTDTVNMSEAAGKTTERDMTVITWLQSQLTDLDPQQLYDDINKAKTDVTGLTSLELLQKDLKLVPGPSVSIAMSSIMMDAKDLYTRPDMLEALKEFCATKSVAAVVIMTVSTPDGTLQRQLAVYSDNRIYRQQIADVLDISTNPGLQLEPADVTLDDTLVFTQGNVTASRKKVMPLVKGFLNGEKTPDDASHVLDAVMSQNLLSQDGPNSLLDLSDSGKGESQGSEKQTQDITSPELFDPFDLVSPIHSETSGSSEGAVLSPATNVDLFDPLNNQTQTDTTVVDNNNADPFSQLLDLNQSNTCSINEQESFTNTTNLSTDFIDNLVDVKSDELEMSEADLLNPPAHDFLLLGTDSPMDMSSGQNSGQGSKVSSYPVTPPNSFMESNFAQAMKEHNLPSFNSQEMVERIKAKKESFGTTGECDSEEKDATYTPQNSYAESNMARYFKETELPSFHNTDMVAKIKQKRASLENAAAADSDVVQDESEETFPWTPHNSYVDNTMDRFGQENLPSFNNAEMVRRIHEKRESLPSLDENENEAGASTIETEQPTSTPYTPQNSCIDGEGEREQGGTDMTQVADRLAGASDVGDQSSNNNVVSDMLAEDIVGDHSAKAGHSDSLDGNAGSLDGNVGSLDGNVGSLDGNGGSHDGNVGSVDSNPVCQEAGLQSNVVAAGIIDDMLEEGGDNSVRTVNSKELTEDQLSEKVMSEVAFTLANELIQNALETFANSEEKTDDDPGEPSVVETSKEVKTKPSEESKPAVTEQAKPRPKMRKLGRNDPNSISVETEYLPEMDPLRGNMDIVESTSLETDAVREVVESSSFRKISCQEFMSPDQRDSLYSEVKVRDEASKDMTEEVQEDKDKTSKDKSEEDKDEDKTSQDKTETVQEDKNDKETVDEHQEKSGRRHIDLDPNMSLPSLSETAVDQSETTDDQEHAPQNPDLAHLQHIALDPDLSLPSLGDTSGDLENVPQSPELAHMQHIELDPNLSLPSVGGELEDSTEQDNVPKDADDQETDGSHRRKVIPVEHKEEFKFSLSTEADDCPESPEGDGQAEMRHHYSNSGTEKKEVYETSAGRISIGLDGERNSVAMDTPAVAGSGKVGDDPMHVVDPKHGDVEKLHVVAQNDVVTAAPPDEDVFPPSPSPGTMSQPPTPASPQSNVESTVVSEHAEGENSAQVAERGEEPPAASHTPKSSTSSAQGGMKGVEVREEWQDDGYPGMLAEEGGSSAVRPQSLQTTKSKKKIVPDLNLLSDEDASGSDMLADVDDLETPNDLDTPDDLLDSDDHSLEWEIKRKIKADDTPVLSPGDAEPIPEYSEQEEKEDARHWKTVVLGDREFRIDLRVIEPYKKVLSHGGYYGDGLNAIILFSGCYLPDRRRKDYHYVMDNLFYYVVHTLEQLVAEDYMIIYFHGATPRKQMPGLSWLKKCYQMIDRRLRKNLKALLLVHPTLWLRTVVMMTRPFISSKFLAKLRFVRTLHDLSQMVPMEHVYVPDQVKSYDSSLHHPSQDTPSSPKPHSADP